MSRLHVVLDTSIYKSVESLVNTDEPQYRGSNRRLGSRAASCSDLLLDFDERRKVSEEYINPALVPRLFVACGDDHS